MPLGHRLKTLNVFARTKPSSTAFAACSTCDADPLDTDMVPYRPAPPPWIEYLDVVAGLTQESPVADKTPCGTLALAVEGVFMRRGRLLLSLGAVALLGVAGLALLLWLATPALTPGVTLENFRRLREGMSLRQVEALLGPHQLKEGSHKAWHSKDKDIAIWLVIDGDHLRHGHAMRSNDHSDDEHLHPDDSFLTGIHQWLHSTEIAVYYEQRSYFVFAITAGVLALLLWLYRRSCRQYWRSLLAVSAVVLWGLAGCALFIVFLFEITAVPSDDVSLLDRVRQWLGW
jgi:hypothetical protein